MPHSKPGGLDARTRRRRRAVRRAGTPRTTVRRRAGRTPGVEVVADDQGRHPGDGGPDGGAVRGRRQVHRAHLREEVAGAGPGQPQQDAAGRRVQGGAAPPAQALRPPPDQGRVPRPGSASTSHSPGAVPTTRVPSRARARPCRRRQSGTPGTPGCARRGTFACGVRSTRVSGRGERGERDLPAGADAERRRGRDGAPGEPGGVPGRVSATEPAPVGVVVGVVRHDASTGARRPVLEPDGDDGARRRAARSRRSRGRSTGRGSGTSGWR